MPYIWDAKGNLLSDGVSTYSYDHANRLTAVSRPPSAVGFAYNGLGDRLQQTMDRVPTNYTLDLNTGLTQVLADGDNTYLYGLGRIGEQQPGGWQYHLGDALGSVRHLADASAAVASARAYEPFGTVLTSAGPAASSYAFTGEWAVDSDLLYLRARYLSTDAGRFVTKDIWLGDISQPPFLNRWAYVANNPVTLTDPSGQKPACRDIIPSWRGLLESLRLCDPKGVPKLSEREMEFFRSLDELLPTAEVRCGEGTSPLGPVCVPVIVASELGKACESPFLTLEQSQAHSQEEERRECRRYTDAAKAAEERLRQLLTYKRFQTDRLIGVALELAIRELARSKGWNHLTGYRIAGRDHVFAYYKDRDAIARDLERWLRYANEIQNADVCAADQEELRRILGRLSNQLDTIERRLQTLEELELAALIEREREYFPEYEPPPEVLDWISGVP